MFYIYDLLEELPTGVQAPIFNVDILNQFSRPIHVSPYDKSVSLNPNLFKNNVPTFNGDQSKSNFFTRYFAPAPPPPLNINTLPQVLPFNQYFYPSQFRIPLTQPQPAIGINPNIFTNPVPINNMAQWVVSSFNPSTGKSYYDVIYNPAVASPSILMGQIWT